MCETLSKQVILFGIFACLLVPSLAWTQGQIVVADRSGGTLTVIDVATDSPTVIAMPPSLMAPEPMSVTYSAAHNRVFVGDRANDRVVVFNAGDFEVETSVDVGSGVFHMWASDIVDQLWVINDIDNTMTVIDTVTLDIITTVPAPADLVAAGGRLHDVILDPVRSFVYATMLGMPGPDDYVVKYSTNTFVEVDRQAVCRDPHVSLARQNDMLYVPCQHSNAVFVLDRNTLDVLQSISVPNAHGAGMARNGKRFYTTNISSGGVDGLFEIDTVTNSVVDFLDTPVAVPHNIALTPNGKKLYITHSGVSNNFVSVYKRKNSNRPLELVTIVNTGSNPFGLAYVP